MVAQLQAPPLAAPPSEIVEISEEDLPLMVGMAGEFFREGKLPGVFKPDVFLQSWSYLLKSGLCRIIGLRVRGSIVGALGFTIMADLNTSLVNAQELFWFVAPEHRRGRAAFTLLAAYEEKARVLGAHSVTMAHLESTHQDLGRFYERKGYSKVETYYRKDL